MKAKGGDALSAIHELTHDLSAGSNAAFKILPATTAKIDYQLCSIFPPVPLNSCRKPATSVDTNVAGEVAYADVAAIASYQFLVVLDATLQLIEILL